MMGVVSASSFAQEIAKKNASEPAGWKRTQIANLTTATQHYALKIDKGDIILPF